MIRSYCDLRAQLAVEVYGVAPVVGINYFVVMSATLVAGILIVISVFGAYDYSRKAKLATEREYADIEFFEEIIKELVVTTNLYF